MCGVHVEEVAGHKPIEEHAERRQVLLDGRRGELTLHVLDEGTDIETLHAGETADAAGVGTAGFPAVQISLRFHQTLEAHAL